MKAVVYIDHEELIAKESMDFTNDDAESKDCLDESKIPKYDIDTDDQVTCAICFHELKRHIAVLECNHRFHLGCLTDWYNQPNCNYKCPMCFVQQEIVTIENDGVTPKHVNLAKKSSREIIKKHFKKNKDKRQDRGHEDRRQQNRGGSNRRRTIKKMLCCFCCKKKRSNQVLN